MLIAGCTDEIQVVDAGLGALIKRYYDDVVQEWFNVDRNWEEWTGANMTASRKRVLTTHWYGEGYNRACMSYNFPASFDHTGSNLTADGSGDNLIKLQGLDEFTFTLEDAKRNPITGEFEEGQGPLADARVEADNTAGDSDNSEHEEFSEKEDEDREGEDDEDDGCSTDAEEGPPYEPGEDWMVEDPIGANDGQVLGLEGKTIAHRFEIHDWYVGVVKRRVTCSINREENGRYATKYPDSRKEYFHDLFQEDYGVHKMWVVVRPKT